MPSPELLLVSLSNGDSALYVNGKAVYCRYRIASGAPVARDVGRDLSEALSVKMANISMKPPKKTGWNWDDVFLLARAKLIPDCDVQSEGGTDATVTLQ